MKKGLVKQLFKSAGVAHTKLAKLTSQEKALLERTWDIEHAYYSSALEGSKLDRKEFNRLAEGVK